MSRGVIYLMKSSIKGIIKIGKSGIDNWENRIRNLEQNGYWNVTGLKKELVIEIDNYSDIEKLIQNIFSKSRVGSSELFAIDINLAKQFLTALNGKVIYPKSANKEELFEEAADRANQIVITEEKTAKSKRSRFSFECCGIKPGTKLYYIKDNTKYCTVVDDRHVEFKGKVTSLSPLARDLLEMKNRPQGQLWFSLDGKKPLTMLREELEQEGKYHK